MDPNPENDQTPLEDDVPVYADRDSDSDDDAGTDG